MTTLKIVYYGHPALHKIAEPVLEFNTSLKKLVDDMYKTMYEAEGIGLAAPQVGISKKIAVIDVSESRDQAFCIINPVIIERIGEHPMSAGCLSIPGTYGEVPRALEVTVKAQNAEGEFFTIKGQGLLSHCLQHEIDHLNGRLYIDYFSSLKKNLLLKKMKKFLRKEK